MPDPQLANPQGAFGLPIGASQPGNNNLQVCAVFNNSGAHMTPGDLVSWDTSTALSTVSTTTTGSQQLATTATSYAVASSASFGTSGLIVAQGVTTTLGGVKQNLIGIVSAKVDGTHITVAWIRAGAAGSLPASTTLFVPPNTANSGAGQAALVGTTGAGLQAVTYPAVANDPLVAGVVLPPIGLDSSTAAANVLYAPGAAMYIATYGPARVYIGGATVAASGVMSTTATLNGDDVGTAGNSIGTALEANGQKDANNTIRCFIKTS